MHIELVSEITEHGEFASRALRWISQVRDMLFPEFDKEQSRGIVPFDPPVSSSGSWVIGRPTALKGAICVQQRPHNSLGRGATYSRRSWEKLESGLEETYPFRVTLLLSAMIRQGESAKLGSSVLIGVRREADSPGWVRFEASLPPEVVDWHGSPQLQRELSSFVREWVMEFETCYGHIAEDADSLGTALERSLRQYSWDTVPHCRENLRGYSWITVCPAELVVRLGGAPGLEGTGAFYEVAEAAGGSVFLQATRTFDEYGEAATRRVFRALAPILLQERSAQERTEDGSGLGETSGSSRCD